MSRHLETCDCGHVYHSGINDECPHCKDIDFVDNGGDD